MILIHYDMIYQILYNISLRSNGRIPTHMTKFEMINQEKGYCLYPKEEDFLIELGGCPAIALSKSTHTSFTCRQNVTRDGNYVYFNFHGIQSALCGNQQDERNESHFLPARFLVFQMN